jgi:hypothetical protein
VSFISTLACKTIPFIEYKERLRENAAFFVSALESKISFIVAFRLFGNASYSFLDVTLSRKRTNHSHRALK